MTMFRGLTMLDFKEFPFTAAEEVQMAAGRNFFMFMAATEARAAWEAEHHPCLFCGAPSSTDEIICDECLL